MVFNAILVMDQIAALVFPHQLFEHNPILEKVSEVYLVEDPLFFTQYPFHKKKIILHRASMKFYEQWLLKKKKNVHYVEAHDKYAQTKNLFSLLAKNKISAVRVCEPGDYLLERRLKRYSERAGISIEFLPSPQFLNTLADVTKYFSTSSSYLMHHFYTHQRKRLDILVENKKPVGGKWSFDEENRKKIPKGLSIPERFVPAENEYVKEAVAYAEKKFKTHYGVSTGFEYAVNFTDARKCLREFIQKRFALFGPYEDAMQTNGVFLFHSVLTPYLNTGLLTPDEVIKAVLEAGNEIPLASMEGFIRQVIGWREFIRGIYVTKGVQQRRHNFWNHQRSLPKGFYTGETGIVPVDAVVSRLQRHAYSHHIERLMVMGNFMMLCEFHPDDVYQWFMEMYIDAYDWVMVPNVYGMSQFADGGVMSTKPYMSGSNYLMKMSDFSKGPWTKTWDGLYWRFIHVHREFFESNQRTMMITRTLDRMDKQTLKTHLSTAEKFLEGLN